MEGRANARYQQSGGAVAQAMHPFSGYRYRASILKSRFFPLQFL